MNASDEVKIVFTGPMGAGKTTAIAAISEIPPVTTEVDNNDRFACDKDGTTVALDFGQITLDDASVVRLYGTPGQERFRFMWDILGDGALGIVILIDASHPDALHHLDQYVEAFADACRRGVVVIGIGRGEAQGAVPLQRFVSRLEIAGLSLPIFCVDVRRRDNVLLLIETLLCVLEAGATEACA